MERRGKELICLVYIEIILETLIRLYIAFAGAFMYILFAPIYLVGGCFIARGIIKRKEWAGIVAIGITLLSLMGNIESLGILNSLYKGCRYGGCVISPFLLPVLIVTALCIEFSVVYYFVFLLKSTTRSN